MNFIAANPRPYDQDLDVKEAWWEVGTPEESVPVVPVSIPKESTSAPTPAASGSAGSSEIHALFDRAEAAATSGDWRTAAELFLTMVERAPKFGPAYVGLASASFAIGDVSTGAMALEHAITLYPDNATLHSQLGVALAHSGHLERAQEAFLRVLDLEPTNVDALVSLAHLCRATKHFVEAVELLDQAHRLEPQNPNVLGAIGTCALDLGDRTGAQASYDQLRALAPEHAETQLLGERLAG